MNHPNRAFSIRVFLPDGTPEGIRIIEKSNWTGCGVVVPRPIFAEAKTRPEIGRTGVYILVGQSEDQALPTIYVGQCDVVRDRLEQHNSKKDFWTWAVFFVSKDESLNRAHVQHLEARLIQLAAEAKRATLDNQAAPQLPHLTEADQADVESFLADMLSILPLVGLTAFEKPRTPGRRKPMLFLNAKGIKATGYESAEGFVVRKGSEGVVKEVKSILNFLRTLRASLLEKGVLVDRDDHLVLEQDYAFSSPSTAAGVMLGRNANGRIEWKDANGRTLKELQEAAAPAGARDSLGSSPQSNQRFQE